MLNAVKDDPQFIRREVIVISALKGRFLYSLTGAVICAGGASVFLCLSVWFAAVLLVILAAVLAVLALHTSSDYRAARLICDNPILDVGLASVSETGGAPESTVKVVISGFGILMDGRPYKFGHGGVDLKAAVTGRERITLSFGGEGKTYSVRLLHGVADRAEVEKLQNRLRYETGVVAEVSGWYG